MWYNSISKDSDVVISTRVRFARSIAGYKFPHIMNSKELSNIVSLVEKAVDKDEYTLFRMRDIEEINRNALMEQHLISKEFVGNDDGAIITNNDNSIVTMINEEDHLRIQSFSPGLEINKCYDKLCDFTDNLNKKIEFAISEKYGYLSACPTNVGSAMRVSVMLHLPALAKMRLLNKLLDQAIDIGISVRGIYGENSNSIGNIYQISNQRTLGISDEEIISNIKIVVTSIIEQERKAREAIKNANISMEDSIYRSYGILKYARNITADEAIKLLAKVRMGVACNILDDIKLEKVQSLMVNVEPNTLKTILKDDFDEKLENTKRAEYIRKELV